MRNKLFIFLLCVLLPVAAFSEPPAVRADHPDTYTVVKGDTLWDISGRFLEEPWRWPEIWEVNPQIANPHLIYPGDEISLTYRDGRPVLTVNRGAGGPRYVKLSPEARAYPHDEAIPAIPIEAIRPFLSEPLVVEEDEMTAWPYVVSSFDQHLIAGPGNKIYIRSLPDDYDERYSIYRRGPAYVLPDDVDMGAHRTLTTNTKYSDKLPEGEVLGYQAIYVGDAAIQRGGDPATAIITAAEREVLVGDRLVPQSEREGTGDFIPKPVEHEVEGKIVSVIDGVSEIGNYQVVILSLGTEQGMEIGNVLGVYQTGKVVRDKVVAEQRVKEIDAPWLDYFGQINAEPELVELPPEFAGVVMVFRTFDRVSYALVMDTERPIHVYDTVSNL